MRRYLLDSGPAQDFINRRRGIDQQVLAHRRRGHHVGICVPVLGELWSGIEGGTNRAWNISLLKTRIAPFTIWPYDIAAAKEFGRLFIQLQRMGRTMQQIDVQIAAIALTLGNCTVVTMDSDLAAVPGLAVENWATP